MMLVRIAVLVSLLSVGLGALNNVPKFNTRKVWDCTNTGNAYVSSDGTCRITFVAQPFLSMTYYDQSTEDGRLSLREGYRAYFNESYGPPRRLDQNPNVAGLFYPITLDGTFRAMLAINAQVPSPTIIANENQVLQIVVHNELPDAGGLSFHWHGMFQRGTPDMDGVAFVTQSPIPSFRSFTYQFRALPAGTHWYHAHTGSHRSHGLYGALIIKDGKNITDDRYDFDDPARYTLILMDWQKDFTVDPVYKVKHDVGYWKESPGNIPPYNEYTKAAAPDDTEVAPVPFWSGLINDKGRHYDEAGSHNKGQLNIFSVQPNQRYRFRLIGAQSLYSYRFSIEGHKLTVIATDGNLIKSISNVDYIIVTNGERYDVVVETNNAVVPDHWILAETLEVGPTEPFYNNISDHKAEAILHYENAAPFRNQDPVSNPRSCTPSSPCVVVNCPFKSYPSSFNIRCINVDAFEDYVNETIPDSIHSPTKTLFYNFGEEPMIDSSVNGIEFRFPSYPPLTNYQDFVNADQICPVVGCDVESSRCLCTHVIDLTDIPAGETVEIVMTNRFTDGYDADPESSHPVHLHGHRFYVVKVGYPSFDNGVLVPNSDIECVDNSTGGPCRTYFHTVDGKQTVRWTNNVPPSGLDTRNRANLVQKDTVIVPFGGYTVIRLTVNNSGWWFFHCHIEAHQLNGMAAIVRISTGGEGSNLNAAQLWMVLAAAIACILVAIF